MSSFQPIRPLGLHELSTRQAYLVGLIREYKAISIESMQYINDLRPCTPNNIGYPSSFCFDHDNKTIASVIEGISPWVEKVPDSKEENILYQLTIAANVAFQEESATFTKYNHPRDYVSDRILACLRRFEYMCFCKGLEIPTRGWCFELAFMAANLNIPAEFLNKHLNSLIKQQSIYCKEGLPQLLHNGTTLPGIKYYGLAQCMHDYQDIACTPPKVIQASDDLATKDKTM